MSGGARTWTAALSAALAAGEYVQAREPGLLLGEEEARAVVVVVTDRNLVVIDRDDPSLLHDRVPWGPGLQSTTDSRRATLLLRYDLPGAAAPVERRIRLSMRSFRTGQRIQRRCERVRRLVDAIDDRVAYQRSSAYHGGPAQLLRVLRFLSTESVLRRSLADVRVTRHR